MLLTLYTLITQYTSFLFLLDIFAFEEYYIFVEHLFFFIFAGGIFLDRTVLHVDCNKFFASVECLHRPEIRHLPVAVGGDGEKRHGIILTANGNAARFGVKTAEPIWQAKQKCPDLVIVPPNYPLYMRFSKMAREIYSEYTDRVESFGLDECWLDVSSDVTSERDRFLISEEIRKQVKRELGITVSIGASWNKVFSKLGSDYKKPDAVTVFNRENYKNLVFPLPTRDLLYIGSATEKKLASHGIFSIGDLAAADPHYLLSFLGKNGLMLHSFANGTEDSPVAHIDFERNVKSIGNSVTTPRDLLNFEDIKLTLMVLADSVARRMREQGFLCRNVGVTVRDASLQSFTRQVSFANPIGSANAIMKYAMEMVYANLKTPFSIRSVGVSVSELCSRDETVQFDLFGAAKKEEKHKVLDDVVDKLKNRFGSNCVKPACLLKDASLTGFSPYDDHTVHPEGWFR